MKKVNKILCLIVVFFTSYNLLAQNTCATSYTVTENTGWRGLDSFNVSERWHQFTAVDNDYELKFYIRNYNSGIHTIIIYDGNCSALNDLGATIQDVGDTLTINLNGLTPSNDYFIYMRNGDNPNDEVYNLKLKNLNSLNPALPGCGSATCGVVSSTCELVCNGSFECNNGVFPPGPGYIQSATNWTSISPDNTPDYFHSSGNSDWNNQPCNYFGSQYPYDSPNYFPDRAYAGIMVATYSYSPYNIQYQEYIQTKLNKPMVAGKTYVISFQDSQADNAHWDVTNPRIWLTNSQINLANTTTLSGGVSAIVNPTPSRTNWQKVIYCYTATGNEQFLTIGGMSVTTNVAYTTTCTSTPSSSYNMVGYDQQGYLYIDEVSVTELNFNIPLSYTICNTNTIQIANTQSCLPTDMSLTYTWSPPTGLSNQYIFNPVASHSATTVYGFSITPTFTAGGSCPNITKTVTVYNAPSTPPTLTATTLWACPNTTVGLGANIPAYNYTWMPGSLTGSNVVVNFMATTTYTAIYTNSVGCLKTATIQVQSLVPANFTMTAVSSNYTVCTNLSQTASLSVTSNTTGLTYTWNPTALTGSMIVVTPTAPTVYTVSALLNGCNVQTIVSVSTKSDCCSTTLTAFTSTSINTSTILNTPFAFNNDLVVQSGATLEFIGTEFVFAPNVKVTVKSGGVLKLEGAHLYACGTDMWQGIVLEDGSQMRATNGANDNLIEDAITAIDVANHTTSTFTTFANGILFIEKTTFNKNFIDISIINYQRTFTPYPFDIHACVFTCRSLTYTPTNWPSTSTVSPGLRAVTNNTAGLQVPYLLNSVATASLKNPYSGQPSQKGVQLISVGATTGTNIVHHAIQIGRTSNYTEYNIFDNHGQGIEAVNSSVRSLNNVFQNSRQYTYDPPGPQPPYTFGGNGIRSYVSNEFNALLEVGSTNYNFGNRFYDCHYAINGENIYSSTISYATIRSTHSTASLSAVTGSVGILLKTNRLNYTINNNHIANVHTAVHIPIAAGTYSSGSGSGYGILARQIQLQNNYIGSQTTTAAGITTQYVDNAISISAPSNSAFVVPAQNFAVQTNTINRIYRGISINGVSKTNFPANTYTNTVLLVQDNAFNNTQYAIRYLNNNAGIIRGNTLTGYNTTNTLVSLYYGGSSTTASIVCNNLNNSWRAFEFNGANNGTNWKGNTMTTHSVGFALTGTGVTGTLGSLSNAINNQWNSAITNDTWVETGSDAVFSKMFVQSGNPWQPKNNSGSGFPLTYYSASGNTISTTGSFSCTSGGGGGGGGNNFASSSFAQPNSQNVFVTSTSFSEEEKYIQDEAVFNIADNNSLSLTTSDLNYYNQLKNTAHGKYNLVEANLYNGNFTTAQSLNAAITPTNGVEQNYKDFYTLYHKHYTTGLNTADESLLLSLAHLCPGKDGAVVYKARALRAYINAAVYYYPNDCSEMFSSRHNSSDADGSFMPNKLNVGIYPNPNSGNFSIISKNEKESLQLQIFDVSGKELINTNIVTENFVYLLNTNLNNGVYFVSVKNQQGETITKKLVVSK